MSKEKMVKISPVADQPEKSPLERMRELTRRIIRVPKSELPTTKPKSRD